MTKFVVIAVAALALTQSAMSVAGDKLTDSRAKPSSFVPHPHTKTHIYGTPIHPAVVGRSRVSHHQLMAKQRASSQKKQP